MGAERSTPEPAAVDGKPEDAVEVGRVLGAWGLRGGLKIKPLAADPQALFSCKRWFVEPAVPLSGPGSGAPRPVLLRIKQARMQGETVVATAHDLDDRDQAQALKGARVFISRASFPTPEEDEFYWVDLIGCRVLNRMDVDLGEVVGLIETGPHCVLRIAAGEGDAHELLIPFVKAYVDQVDLAQRRIGVDWESEPE